MTFSRFNLVFKSFKLMMSYTNNIKFLNRKRYKTVWFLHNLYKLIYIVFAVTGEGSLIAIW